MNNNPNNRSIDRPSEHTLRISYYYITIDEFICLEEFLLNLYRKDVAELPNSKMFERGIMSSRDTVRDQLGRQLGDGVLYRSDERAVVYNVRRYRYIRDIRAGDSSG